MARPRLLAYISISKYQGGLLWYRQEVVFNRTGIDLGHTYKDALNDKKWWGVTVSLCGFLESCFYFLIHFKIP